MSREEEIRAAALLAAARGAVNPGVVIVNAKRFAHYIINGTDLNEVPVVVPAKDGEFRRIKHNDGCAFLDSRGFCTCGADPDLMPVRRRTDVTCMGNPCENCSCGYGMHVARNFDQHESCVTADCTCPGWKGRRGQ